MVLVLLAVCLTLIMVINAEVNPIIASNILLRSCLCFPTLSAIILMDLSCSSVVLEITCSMISVQSNEGLRLLSDSPSDSRPW